MSESSQQANFTLTRANQHYYGTWWPKWLEVGELYEVNNDTLLVRGDRDDYWMVSFEDFDHEEYALEILRVVRSRDWCPKPQNIRYLFHSVGLPRGTQAEEELQRRLRSMFAMKVLRDSFGFEELKLENESGAVYLRGYEYPRPEYGPGLFKGLLIERQNRLVMEFGPYWL